MNRRRKKIKELEMFLWRFLQKKNSVIIFSYLKRLEVQFKSYLGVKLLTLGNNRIIPFILAFKKE